MARYRLLILLLLCCAGWQAGPAQYRFDHWTTDDGLPQNGVRGIAQTPDGYLWFTTLDGLVRFDGVKFTIFNKSNTPGIINNRFWVMRALPDGSVWAATEAGDLTIYRGGIFTSYAAADVPDEKIFEFTADASGDVLIETNKSFFRLQDGKFEFIRPDERKNSPKTVYEGRSGARWELYPDKTLRIQNGETLIYDVSIKHVENNYLSLIEDSRGGLLIADENRLVYLSDGDITEFAYPESRTAHRFWEEQDGSIWFATGGYSGPGVGLGELKNGRLKTYGIKEGLSNDYIFNVFKDREGTVWLATDKGLNRLRRQIITSLSKEEGLVNNEVYPILQARDGSIYAGTVGGLTRYEDGKFHEVYLNNSRTQFKNVQSLAEDATGQLWIGLVGGLFVIESGKPRDLSRIFEFGRTVSAIYPDAAGTVWLGTDEGGVYQLRDDKIVANYTTEQGLAGNDVKVIHPAKDGSFWFGTYNGLSRLKDGKFTNYTTRDGLPSNFIRAIKEDDDGTLWIGTYDGGLARFADGRFFNFTTENGLYNNGVFAIREDRRGNFWMSSNKGIFRASKQQLIDFAEGRTARYESVAYGKNDGMLNSECNGGRQPSSMIDTDGRIWFPTIEGIAMVDPDRMESNALPPNVVIESITVDRENVSPTSEQLEIRPAQEYLDITYTALSLIKSDQIPFRYKLEGLDKDWIEAGTRRTVNYSHLPPGDYTFRVTAANTDGIWNTEGRSIKILVAAPFYKTVRFWAALLIVLAGLVFLLFRYRIKQLRKLAETQEAFSRQLIESQEEERKRIAREIHDGLGQNLLIIKNRAKLGRLVDGKEQTDEQFFEIQESVTDALSEVRTIAYNLRPLHLERLGLTSTIEEMIEEIESVAGIEIAYEIESVDSLFTPENEINFYRIVQEFLNNIVKHSQATKAHVTISRREPGVVLTVTDNGTGFEIEKAKEKHGMGLSGIAERVKILGGSQAMVSEIGKGTTVTVEFRLENK